MWFRLAGSTAMLGSLFGERPSQSISTLADGSPETRHSNLEGVFESCRPVWSPRPDLTSDVTSGRNFEFFGMMVRAGAAWTAAWLSVSASVSMTAITAATRNLFMGPPWVGSERGGVDPGSALVHG